MFCATDDYERGFDGLVFRFNVEAREFVIEDFARALPPVSEDTHFGFELEIDGIGNAAVRAGTSDTEKIAGFFRFLHGRGEDEPEFTDSSPPQSSTRLAHFPA